MVQMSTTLECTASTDVCKTALAVMSSLVHICVQCCDVIGCDTDADKMFTSEPH